MAGDGYVSPVLRIGSLFSGIGGLELGLEAATGGHVVWQVEVDPWCRKVLARHWPHAVRYDDVRTVGEGLGTVDIICGGFPCQDVSLAGSRVGFGGERSSLWREYRRVVAVLRPRFVFVENVPGLLTSQGGWDFGEVLGSLAALGYDAEWGCFRASDVGAPHRRERVFVLAYSDGRGCGERITGVGGAVGERRGCADLPPEAPHASLLADAARVGEREPADAAHAVATCRDARDEPRHGGPLAHGDALRELQPQGSERDEWVRARDGCHVAHGERIGLQEPWNIGGRGHSAEGRDWQAGHVVNGGAGGTEPRVGGAVAGFPRWVDGRWPAGRGEAQHEWEAPRTVAKVPRGEMTPAQRNEARARAPRIKALGNAVVPQVAALAWCTLSARAGIDV